MPKPGMAAGSVLAGGRFAWRCDDMAKRKPKKPAAAAASSSALAAYWRRSQQPLPSLFFLLPLIAVYEVGVLLYATDEGHSKHILARSYLREFLEWFGVTGYYLPGLIVVVVLLCWHFARRDKWTLEPRYWGLMWVESMLLALPMFVFALVLFQQPLRQSVALAGAPGLGVGWQAEMVFSVGAGIYEELLFRLMLIALVHLLLVDLMGLADYTGAAGAVVISSVAFALYHFVGERSFQWGLFCFYTLAGFYLAGVYVMRGLGIVAGVHALYDVMVVVANATHSHR